MLSSPLADVGLGSELGDGVSGGKGVGENANSVCVWVGAIPHEFVCRLSSWATSTVQLVITKQTKNLREDQINSATVHVDGKDGLVIQVSLLIRTVWLTPLDFAPWPVKRALHSACSESGLV